MANEQVHPHIARILNELQSASTRLARLKGARCLDCGEPLGEDSPACPARMFHEGAPLTAVMTDTPDDEDEDGWPVSWDAEDDDAAA